MLNKIFTFALSMMLMACLTQFADAQSFSRFLGDGQVNVRNEQLRGRFGVRALDASNMGIQGLVVTFEISEVPTGSTGHTLDRTSATTDSTGTAFVRLTLGSQYGQYFVKASATLPGETNPREATFTATADDYIITILGGGNHQKTAKNMVAAVPLAVKVTDRHGTTISHGNVEFSIVDFPSGSTMHALGFGDNNNFTAFPDPITDIALIEPRHNGVASRRLRMGSVNGVYKVRVSIAGKSVTFELFTTERSYGYAGEIETLSGEAAPRGTLDNRLAINNLRVSNDDFSMGIQLTWDEPPAPSTDPYAYCLYDIHVTPLQLGVTEGNPIDYEPRCFWETHLLRGLRTTFTYNLAKGLEYKKTDFKNADTFKIPAGQGPGLTQLFSDELDPGPSGKPVIFIPILTDALSGPELKAPYGVYDITVRCYEFTNTDYELPYDYETGYQRETGSRLSGYRAFGPAATIRVNALGSTGLSAVPDGAGGTKWFNPITFDTSQLPAPSGISGTYLVNDSGIVTEITLNWNAVVNDVPATGYSVQHFNTADTSHPDYPQGYPGGSRSTDTTSITYSMSIPEYVLLENYVFHVSAIYDDAWSDVSTGFRFSSRSRQQAQPSSGQPQPSPAPSQPQQSQQAPVQEQTFVQQQAPPPPRQEVIQTSDNPPADDGAGATTEQQSDQGNQNDQATKQSQQTDEDQQSDQGNQNDQATKQSQQTDEGQQSDQGNQNDQATKQSQKTDEGQQSDQGNQNDQATKQSQKTDEDQQTQQDDPEPIDSERLKHCFLEDEHPLREAAEELGICDSYTDHDYLVMICNWVDDPYHPQNDSMLRIQAKLKNRGTFCDTHADAPSFFTDTSVRNQLLEMITSEDVPEHLLDVLQMRYIVAAPPKRTALLPNYPNPFNPETWMPYELAVDTNVRITIFNAQGQAVRKMHLGYQDAGYYLSRDRAAHWDGKNESGERVSSGVYFYMLSTDKHSLLRKMVILK